MKTIFTSMIILLLTIILAAEKVSILPDLTDPSDLKVDSAHIYIIDGARILIYSRTGYNLLKKLGKEGEGEGEFNPYFGGQHRLYLDIQADEILVTSNEKLSVFSKSFAFREDHKLPAQIGYSCKAGENLVASNYYWEKNPAVTEKVIIFGRKNNNYNTTREIYKTLRGGGRLRGLNPGKKNNFPVIRHTFDYQVWKNQIFIGDTRRGFYFTVFDDQGNQLHTIQKEYTRIPVTEADRQYEIAKFKSGKMWKKYERLIEPVFPDVYPPYRQFRISDDHIYVFTHKRMNQKGELLGLDLKGNFVGKTMIPISKYFSVFDGRYYYLHKNEDQEWELYLESVILEDKNETNG